MTAIHEVPLRKIDIGRNVRLDVGDVGELAATIAELGVLQPVKVMPTGSGRYHLVFGQRRVLAARQAGLETIPAIVVAPNADLGPKGARRAAEQLAENVQRKSLNPVEKANAIADVLEAHPDLTQRTLARQLGRSESWLSVTLRILDLDPSALELLRTGQLAEATARTLLPLPANRQARMARRVVREGWTQSQTEREVQRALNPPAKRPSRGQPPIVELPGARVRSRSVRLAVRSASGPALVTIGVGTSRYVELILEDADGGRAVVDLHPDDAQLIGRRLEQACRAVVA